jgi:nucleoid DNA-binding protein
VRPLRAAAALAPRAGGHPHCPDRSSEEVALALTQTQFATAVADRGEISRAEGKRLLGVIEEIVLEELGNAQKVRIAGLAQLTVRVKPAQKKRQGQISATQGLSSRRKCLLVPS